MIVNKCFENVAKFKCLESAVLHYNTCCFVWVSNVVFVPKGRYSLIVLESRVLMIIFGPERK
jgi:hypothetical protein